MTSGLLSVLNNVNLVLLLYLEKYGLTNITDKEVHKAPALDLVAMFAIGSASGPQPQHIPILQQLQHHYNDSLILLLFHPDTILDGNMTGSKLPISLYESFYEPATEAADKGLQVEGWGMGRQLQMRFRELPYEVETGEAEMIAVDFVAKGSGSATAIPNTASSQKKSPESSTSKKGKAKADLTPPDTTNKENPLSPEDEDLVSSLTGKANAIKMLHQRINLIKTYLQEVPSSYLNDASIPTTAEPNLNLNQPLLRNISSLLSRLPLLTPPSSTPTTTTPGTPAPPSSLATASAEEQSDVHLVSLLSALTRSIAEAKDMGSKYAVVTKARSDKLGPGGARSMRGGFASGFGGSLEDSPGSPWGTGAGEMVPEY